MRRIVGYENGRAVWSENTPAEPGLLARVAGTLVRGDSGGERLNTDSDRSASQRYRQRHPDRVNAYQRAYRARIRAEVAEMRSEDAA